MKINQPVRIIVSDWLIANGYDGLVNGCGECGCPIGDLMPCENSIAGLGDCMPAYRFECGKCRNFCDNLPFDVNDPDEWCDKQNPDYSELYSTDKDFCNPDYSMCRNADENAAAFADVPTLKTARKPMQPPVFELGA